MKVFQAIQDFFHPLTHPFIRRQLVWRALEGGGMEFGLGCVVCGSIKWIDYYKGMQAKSDGNFAVHVEEFLDVMFPDEDYYCSHDEI